MEIECVLKCKAMKLESLKCIVRCLERVKGVRLKYVSFSLETQSPNGHLNIYTSVLSKSLVEGEELLEIVTLVYMYISYNVYDI